MVRWFLGRVFWLLKTCWRFYQVVDRLWDEWLNESTIAMERYPDIMSNGHGAGSSEGNGMIRVLECIY